ncbi:MAG: DNA-directed RNA polymerase subunit delta [Bacilli bacterium]|nr:DNA-directed RNA polymerase subunit delta [Bacilli bacterium]
MSKSLIEFAYDFLSKSKKEVTFEALWAYVKKESGLSDEEAMQRVGRFYSNLMLDGRFVTLGENIWDLRVRHTFDKVHIDMRDVYSDVEEGDGDEEEDAEEKEYNDAFKEPEEKSDDAEEETELEEDENKDNDSSNGVY